MSLPRAACPISNFPSNVPISLSLSLSPCKQSQARRECPFRARRVPSPVSSPPPPPSLNFNFQVLFMATRVFDRRSVVSLVVVKLLWIRRKHTYKLAAAGVAVGSHGPLLPAEEVYWQKVLPNVPMPSALQDLLHPGKLKNGQYVGNLDIGLGPIVLTTYGVTKFYGKNAGKKSHHHFHNDSFMSLFFLEEDLQPGVVKSMLFFRTIVRSTFLSRQEADSLPFSSSKLPEILDHFSIKPDTTQAANIKTTLNECELPEFQGEHKFCATSLESLVESSMSALGTRSVQAMSTAVSKEGTPKQPYTVAASGLKRLPGSDTVVACHSLLYPYVVYYCHSIKGIRVYRVSLTAGKSETKVDAVAACHTDTANWNPEHPAFQVLNAKPGAVVCHILSQDDLLWTPNK